jgi:hypothetical protein
LRWIAEMKTATVPNAKLDSLIITEVPQLFEGFRAK